MRTIFSFRSRSAALRFRDDLMRNGIRCAIVNTPQDAGVGCGLSVAVGLDMTEQAGRILHMFPSDQFVGAFTVNKNGYVVETLPL